MVGVSTPTFQASTAMQNAFIVSIATTVNVPTSAIIINDVSIRDTDKYYVNTPVANVAYTITTTTATISSSALTMNLASTSTTLSLTKALASYGVTYVAIDDSVDQSPSSAPYIGSPSLSPTVTSVQVGIPSVPSCCPYCT